MFISLLLLYRSYFSPKTKTCVIIIHTLICLSPPRLFFSCPHNPPPAFLSSFLPLVVILVVVVELLLLVYICFSLASFSLLCAFLAADKPRQGPDHTIYHCSALVYHHVVLHSRAPTQSVHQYEQIRPYKISSKRKEVVHFPATHFPATITRVTRVESALCRQKNRSPESIIIMLQEVQNWHYYVHHKGKAQYDRGKNISWPCIITCNYVMI